MIVHFRTSVVLMFIAAGACADGTPVTPIRSVDGPTFAADRSRGSGELVTVSPRLAEMNAALAARGAQVRIAKAELLRDGTTWDGASSTLILANDRARGIGTEWVQGDPRRNNRRGVTYQVASARASQPFVRNPDFTGVRQATFAELDALIEEGMSAWRGINCSNAPIQRVSIPAGTNPDFVDDFFLGRPFGNYLQSADVVQGGWLPRAFFQNVAVFFGGRPEDGNSILGIAFTFIFVDEAGNPTDIDRNGKDDTALSEIFYSTGFWWGTSGALNVVDFYSIITHEAGHSLGLGHFGKVFVTKKDRVDGGGISISEIKYAPYALMNAVYITGRNELAGTDNSSFCQIWATRGKKSTK